MEDALLKSQKYHTDGVMIGRGIFQNPWMFQSSLSEIEKRLDTLLKHLQLYEAAWGNSRPFPIL
jgi:tRNA-dihydrouridine synthase